MEQGYKGFYESVRDNIVRLLPTGRKNEASSSSKTPALLTSRQAAFLLLRRPEELRVEEQERFSKLRQINPEIDLAYDLVQQFASMLRTHTGECLDAFLNKVESSKIPELQTFTSEREKAALTKSAAFPCLEQLCCGMSGKEEAEAFEEVVESTK
jgi:hypothetical protein